MIIRDISCDGYLPDLHCRKVRRRPKAKRRGRREKQKQPNRAKGRRQQKRKRRRSRRKRESLRQKVGCYIAVFLFVTTSLRCLCLVTFDCARACTDLWYGVSLFVSVAAATPLKRSDSLEEILKVEDVYSVLEKRSLQRARKKGAKKEEWAVLERMGTNMFLLKTEKKKKSIFAYATSQGGIFFSH
jgi:hypothetical protein